MTRLFLAMCTFLVLAVAAPAGNAHVLELERATSGPCAGMFRIDRFCTHGTDPAFRPIVGRAWPAPLSLPPRCIGNGTGGARVQVLFVRASDRPDRYAQVQDYIRDEVDATDAIFDESAAETGGSRRVRWAHGPDCVPTVQKVVIDPPADDDYAATVGALLEQGFNSLARKYLVFLDADYAAGCGLGLVLDDDRPGVDNNNDDGPSFAISYRNCWVAGADAGTVPAHELMHTLGAVQDSAPNATGRKHCTDEYDLMCRFDDSGAALDTVCSDASRERLFDCNHDDYFSTHPSGYLATHWNTADSRFLVDQPACDVYRVRMAELLAPPPPRPGLPDLEGSKPPVDPINQLQRQTVIAAMARIGCKPLSVQGPGFPGP